jgi:hypothetical protein
MNRLRKFITYNWNPYVFFGSALINTPLAYYTIKRQSEQPYYPECCDAEKQTHCYTASTKSNANTVISSIFCGTLYSLLGGLSIPINMYMTYKEKEDDKIKVDYSSCECGKIKY